MALATQPYKGARDFYPEDKRIQKYLFKVMRSVVERYGYEEYDAPILEPLDLYLAKTGDEIVNEQTYTFEDRGGRKVALRPEMTPSVSRMVAGRRQELAYPLRWYSIPNLWRYERPQRGRLREHWQLNVDIFGVTGVEAEHEIISVADDLMRSFGAKPDMYEIKISSRKLVDEYLRATLGLEDTQIATLHKLIDRMHKIEHAEFVAQADAIFSPSQREANLNEQLFGFLNLTDTSTLPGELQKHSSAQQMARLLELLKADGITNARFDPTIMRGFDYYTDIVFEVYDTATENNRSMFGGGRYDDLVSLFGVEGLPTVGFGMGDVTLQNFLETHQLLPALKTETELFVAVIGDIYDRAEKIIKELRKNEVRLAVGAVNDKPEKQIKAAIKKSVPYIMFIGEKELEEGQYNLKNLASGQEERHGLERVITAIKDYRRK